jgi:hypothetical protein
MRTHIGNKGKKSIASDKSIKQLFVGKCWDYLNTNFHRFSETNKIKIALAMVQKDMPTQLEGGQENKIVVVYPGAKVETGRTEEVSSGVSE